MYTYISDPPDVYKPLQAVVCDDYKRNQQGGSPEVKEVIFEAARPSGNVCPQDGLTAEEEDSTIGELLINVCMCYLFYFVTLLC